MTTPLAQSRPSSAISQPPNPFRTPSRRSSIAGVNNIPLSHLNGREAQSVDSGDDGRSPKRRKIEHTSAPVPPGLGIAGADSSPTKVPNPIKLWRDPVRLLFQQDAVRLEQEDKREHKAPALPARPWKGNSTAKLTFEETKCGDRVRKLIPVSNVPDKLESPRNTPKFGKGKLAGFFPWIGKHPEDVLSDSSIKLGYFDRAPNPQDKELASGKPNICTALKHRSGLNTLSALFSLLLDQKSSQGGASSASTFKPPPRVTLTEAKRKSWLADLANADVPLRRLNRTIPQGIRGQALLDQCLANAIPINRAMWFAKCVGANEIRTLKRKGTGNNLPLGNECKWLREWTVSVELFIDAMLRQLDRPTWRANVQYALQLCTRLYLENLLDRDHYLDWIVNSFATDDINQTPFWLMVVHLYLPDLVRFRKRGKRLAVALLDKLKTFNSSDAPVLGPLVKRLRTVVHNFVNAQPQCFLMPDQWPTFEPTLETLGWENATSSRIFENLKTINRRVLGTNKHSYTSKSSRVQDLLEILDSARAPYNIADLASKCDSVCDDFAFLVQTLLEWSTTRFRYSEARLYLAVRLIRRWHRLGYDLETPLFEFLKTCRQSRSLIFQDLRHLIAELSRSRTFSTSRYLQWLSSRGGLQKGLFNIGKLASHGTDEDYTLQSCTDPSQILTELSLAMVDAHVVSQRNAMLSRAGYDLAAEADLISKVKTQLSMDLPDFVGENIDVPVDADGAHPDLSELCWSVRTHLTQWLYDRVQATCDRAVQTDRAKGLSVSQPRINIRQFHIIRDALEKMNDLAILANVLSVFSHFPQEDLLAACVDTIDRHAEALAAIGAFEPLCARLCNAYVNLRSIRPFMPLLATSLLILCQHFKNDILSVRALKIDLIKGDPGAAIAACSPFSDGVAESLQQAGATFVEDFEAILQSETNMNEETMTQLFGVLVERIVKESYHADAGEVTLTLCQLLARLKLHRSLHCDQLLRNWLRTLLRENKNQTVVLIGRLSSVGCFDFQAISQAVEDILNGKSHTPSGVHQTISALFTFAETSDFTDSLFYKLSSSRMRYAQTKPAEFLEIVAKAKSSLHVSIDLGALWRSIVCNFVLNDNATAAMNLEVALPQLGPGLSALFGESYGNDDADVILICSLANDFSWPFCKLQLRLLTESPNTDTSGDNDAVTEGFFALASVDSSGSDKARWSELLPAVGPAVAARIYEKAVRGFFMAMPSCMQQKSLTRPDAVEVESFEDASRNLLIAFGTSQKLKGITSTKVFAQIIEKMTFLIKVLGTNCGAPAVFPNPPTSTPTPIASAGSPNSELIVSAFKFFPLLLQMTCLQRSLSNSSPGPVSKQSQQDYIKILLLLVSIALHPALQNVLSRPEDQAEDQDLVAFALDVAATLVDELTEEARILCSSRFLKDKMRDSRIQFLFGSVNTQGSVMNKDVGAGLLVVKDGKGVVGDWKVRQWEVLEGAKEGESWVGLGMFGVRQGND